MVGFKSFTCCNTLHIDEISITERAQSSKFLLFVPMFKCISGLWHTKHYQNPWYMMLQPTSMFYLPLLLSTHLVLSATTHYTLAIIEGCNCSLLLNLKVIYQNPKSIHPLIINVENDPELSHSKRVQELSSKCFSAVRSSHRIKLLTQAHRTNTLACRRRS